MYETTVLVSESGMVKLYPEECSVPPHIVLTSGKNLIPMSPDVETYQAIVEYAFDRQQNITRVYIYLQGKFEEPTQEPTK